MGYEKAEEQIIQQYVRSWNNSPPVCVLYMHRFLQLIAFRIAYLLIEGLTINNINDAEFLLICSLMSGLFYTIISCFQKIILKMVFPTGKQLYIT